jgi:hypothetical protein
MSRDAPRLTHRAFRRTSPGGETCVFRKPDVRQGRIAEMPMHIGSLHSYLMGQDMIFSTHQSLTAKMEIKLLRRFMIERAINNIGAMTAPELKGAAEVSNAALAKLAPKVQWEHSYVAKDKTFCVYLAEDEKAIHEHARLSGFPATAITEVPTIIDPTTARG